MQRFTSSALSILVALALVACGDSESGSSSSSPTAPSSTASASGSANSCAASVAGIPASIPSEAARYTLTINTGAGCSWSGSTDVTWAVVAPAAGVGNGTVVLSVEENSDLVGTRSSTLTIAGQSLRFAQVNACKYALDITRIDVPSAEARVKVHLTTKENCPWTARSASESWVHVRPGSGEGSTDFEVDVTANTSTEIRRALLTIAGVSVPVTQQGR